MNRWLGLGLLLVAAGALALRSPSLDRRPMHNDEAVNALKLQALWERGEYAYDPDEFHGPTLHYFALPFLRVSGARSVGDLSEHTLRLVTVAFGVGLILLLGLLADGLGRPATLGAAALTALSPAMVFYSRYFIHETLLVFFTLVVLAAGWRYTQSRRVGWAVLTGAGLGLMYATKETFVLAVAAMGAAVVLTALWNHWLRAPSEVRRSWLAPLLAIWNWKHALAAAATAMVVAVLFFSSFLSNPRGPLDAILTYLPWLKRAGGHSPHIHPWWFYFERLGFFHLPKGPYWSEGLILLLALVGAVAALKRKGLAAGHTGLARFLAFYTGVLATVYSVISYKTPWCMLGFLGGMILLAGLGASALWGWVRPRGLRIALGALLAAGAGHLGWEAWRASFIYASDRRDPYVYAQTVPDILNLVRRVEGLAKVHSAGYDMLVKVVAPGGDYWPLPWYLRRFRQVGWWEQLPDDPYAPVMIVGAPFGAELDEKSNKRWLMVGLFEMRPRVFFELYVEFELWKRYVETLPRPPQE